MNTTFLEGRLGLTQKRPSYRPTGTHPSPRFASVWRSANRSISLSSTSRQLLCFHSSLTDNTERPGWVLRHGRHWLVCRPFYSPTVTRKVSMLDVLIHTLELVSLVTTNTIAAPVTRILDLVQAGEARLTSPSRVETFTFQGNGTVSKPLDTSWCNKKELSGIKWSAIIEFGFHRIWRILQIKEGVIHRGRRPRSITLSKIFRILHILRRIQ